MVGKKYIQPRILLYGTLFAVFFIFPSLIALYTDWLWFQEIGFQTVFATILKAKLLIGGIAVVAIAGLLYLNLIFFRRLTNHAPIMMSVNKGEYVQLVDVSERVNTFAFPIILAVGLLGGLFAAAEWQTVLQFFNYVPFGDVDPVFGRDIGFYVFVIPYYQFLISLGFFTLFIAFSSALFLYILKGALIFKSRGAIKAADLGGNLLTISRDAKIHLLTLIALWFALTALKIYLIRIPNLLYSTTGPLFGTSYTDIHATLPFLYVLFGISLLGAVLCIWGIKKNGLKLVINVFLLYAGATILGGWLYPALIQNLIVKPNELVKETPYLERHIDATQKAWGLDSIEKRNITGDSTLTMRDIRANEGTIKNVRLWDRGPLLDTFGQLQEIRTYYNFISIDNDRYTIDDEYRQVMLSPRELDTASLPERNFINERLTFTHGMGVALGPVNEVTNEGLPVLFIKDIPPSSDFAEIEIERPEIYFGELPDEYVVVKTRAKEFDYPSGEENVYTTYEGTGGVEISSIFRKALFSIKFNTIKIFLSNDINNQSKILYYRNIRERAKRALPFLTFDSDPYIVITEEGRLKWIYDAYTTTHRYPYSRPIAGVNYMKNSAKIVIDAYDGSMDVYIADPDDPLIQTYQNIFPGILKPIEAMSDDLRSHVRYPEDIFTFQTALYLTYHMENPQIFYNKEDQWEIPVLRGSVSGENIGPIMRHLVMKLPGEEKEEFILMLPFTPRQKNNMSAWIVARSDGEHYGELIVYRFPKQSLVFGPQQIVSRINQDAEISRQISLWDQRGSEVIQGNLLVIPINESILYVRPLYLRAEGGKIPELKRVIVAYEKQIAMEATLDLALSRIFGSSTGLTTQSRSTSPQSITTNSERIRAANQHFNRAQSALRQGNWALYGDEMRQLSEVLRSLE